MSDGCTVSFVLSQVEPTLRKERMAGHSESHALAFISRNRNVYKAFDRNVYKAGIVTAVHSLLLIHLALRIGSDGGAVKKKAAAVPGFVRRGVSGISPQEPTSIVATSVG